MTWTKNILTMFMLFIAVAANAEIREAATMREAVSGLGQGDFVVFDIDNTVLEPAQTLGSDQWFEYRVKVHKSKGKDEKQAVDSAIQDWMPVQEMTDVQLVEAATSGIIRKLQDKGIAVVALTARPDELRSTTINQLRSAGVKFENILFSFGKNKGLVLRDYLTRMAEFKQLLKWLRRITSIE